MASLAGISVHDDMMADARNRLAALGLAYPNGGRVLADDAFRVRTLPRHRENVDGLPIWCVSPTGSEILNGGTTSRDSIGYPIAVVLIASSNDDYNRNLGVYLSWRALVLDHFINQRSLTHQVADVPQPHNVELFTDVIVDPNAFNQNYYYSGLLLRPFIRRQRGQGKG